MNAEKLETVEKSRAIKKKKHRSRSKKSSESDGESDSFDYNLKVESELKDKPEILEFIWKLKEYIRKQDKKIKKLKSSLKRWKSKCSKQKDISTQTYTTEVVIQAEPTLIAESTIQVEAKTLTEEIKEAAENAMLQTGFVYEATSGMYYDYNSGYYYNAELGLYYDGNNGTYLVYNDETKTYDFHSQVDVVPTKPMKTDGAVKKKSVPKRKKQQQGQDNGKRPKIKTKTENSLEEGECTSSEVESEKSEIESNGDEEQEEDCTDVAKAWPPCMRIILKDTTIDKLKVGSLYIITCDGGVIGREGEDKSILIPDINVSKVHAYITFDREASKYMIQDLGSQNGTLLNGTRISPPKQKSELVEVVHGSMMQFGTTKFLCHIHDGQKTCGHCEPGLIQQQEAACAPDREKTVSKNTQHKQELRRLRKKFGIENQENTTELGPGYSDRAKERRKLIGSSDGAEKTQVASLEESIPADNKGFKMLAKMGWSEGQSLGKEGSGLKEPVPLVSNQGTTGLGGAPILSQATVVDKTLAKKQTVWKKTQLRYSKIQDVPPAFTNASSEDEENQT